MTPRNPAIDPRRAALLIMDFQPAILGHLEDHDYLLHLASGAIDFARLAGITVAYVRVAFADEDYEQVPAGISTSGVVLSTVREAADRDYRIYVLADASADPDPHVHAVLTEKVLPMQAHLITVADLHALTATT